MSTPTWHQQCRLREEVRTGTLRLAEFAADLNAVRTGEAPPVYRDPEAFFSRTYPTYNLKRLVRECLQRLAGQGGAPIVRLQVSYGGGKTHTLVTLLHLAEQGEKFAKHATVKEFVQFAGLKQVPKARVVLLPFDKFDVHEGLIVYGPDGGKRTVRTPWGALAYQLAGDAGFARVKAHEDGYDPPAEPLLVDLLRAPASNGLSTLLLLDEAVWYCRSAVNEDQRRLGTLKDFFHALIQAVGKVERCSFVATLIASALEAQDVTGGQVLRALEDEFGRAEETAEPVGKDDLAEVLRRRLFESIAPESERRSIVDALMARMQQLPLREGQKNQQAYDRLLRSYPFHPDLLDVLYQKWTQFPGFQRTRGVLRILALAGRGGEKSDPSAFVGPCTLLGNAAELSDSTLELVKQCEGEGDWPKILVGELEKAREIQGEFPSLKAREMEQAVLATFLHSQPRGQKADPPELHALIAHPTLDVTAVTEGLQKWRDLSWFLSEEPGVWRLGTQPNLTHMHVRALERISSKPELIADELRARIRAARLGDVEDGVVPHNLPDGPKDIADTPDLHFVVLPPECVVELGKGVPAAVEGYFNTTSGPKNPRTYRNAIVALAPDRAKLAGLRERVMRLLGWRAVESGEEAKLLSDVQKKELTRRKREAEDGLADAVRAAYSVLLAVDEGGAVEARPLPPGAETAFARARKALVEGERLLATSLDPELFLPGSYLDLWGSGEKAKKAKELIAAFGQLPRLPRLLKPQVLQDSLARGIREGKIVLQFVRADGSARTLWRVEAPSEDLARPEAEVVPVAFAALHEIEPALLAPGRIEGLWLTDTAPLSMERIESMFDGVRCPRLASPEVVDRAVRAAVQHGLLMARTDGKVFLRQALPDRPIPHDLELLLPPPPVRGADLGPKELPEAWKDGKANLAAMAQAVSRRRGHGVPWVLMRDGVTEALAARLFEVVEDGTWPCGPDDVERVRVRIVEIVELEPAELVSGATQPVWTATAPTLGKLKVALEAAKGRTLPDDVFRKAAETALARGLFALADSKKSLPSGKGLLDARLRMPKASLYAEAQLTAKEIQDFAEVVADMKREAPEMEFSFRVTITAEGDRPTPETVGKLNELVTRVSPKWKLSSERDLAGKIVGPRWHMTPNPPPSADATPLERLAVPALDAILGKQFKVLDEGFIRVIDYMGADASIVQAARVSYGLGTKQIHEDRGLIRYLMRHGHTTPFEMCELKLHLRVPMDCWRQWIRHRTANVNEYSTRYSVAIDAAQATPHGEWRRQSTRNRQGSDSVLDAQTGARLSEREEELHRLARDVYNERLQAGVAREQARKDLPLSTYTEAYWKIDLHNLFHFLLLRMDEHAQEEIRRYATVIGTEVVARWCPLAWEAFLDYQLKGLCLSRLETQVVALLGQGRQAEAADELRRNGLLELKDGRLGKNRERDELEAKLRKMGLPIPWSSSPPDDGPAPEPAT